MPLLISEASKIIDTAIRLRVGDIEKSISISSEFKRRHEYQDLFFKTGIEENKADNTKATKSEVVALVDFIYAQDLTLV